MGIGRMLEEARLDTDYTQTDVWFEYRRRGGTAKALQTVAGWLREYFTPTVDQYDIVASVLNDRLVELGKDPRLPVVGKVPRARTRYFGRIPAGLGISTWLVPEMCSEEPIGALKEVA